MKPKTLLTLGALGVGAWWIYNNSTIFQSLTGTAVSPPAPAAPAPAPAPVTPDRAPAPAADRAPVAAVSIAPETIIAALKSAAGGNGPLNQDQWNYYRNAKYPPALSGAQLASAFPGGPESLSAEDFVGKLQKVGLAGYRRAAVVNYRRKVALS